MSRMNFKLFNVAFGFALVVMKATLDTHTSVILFACVGRCFIVGVLLTHQVTSVEKECLFTRGYFQRATTQRIHCMSSECFFP